MDVGAVGSGPADASTSRVAGGLSVAAPAAPPPTAGTAGLLDDSVSTLVTDLSALDIAKLIDLIERPLPAEATAQLQDLLTAFVSAAVEGDAIRALSALSEIVALDPSRPDSLRADPTIASIRIGVDQFLDRHTTLARLDAEGRLEQAEQAAGSFPSGKLPGWDMRPANMLLIANRVFDSGGLPNYVRAAELAQLVIDGSRWAPGLAGIPVAAPDSARMNSLYAAKQPGGVARHGVIRAIGKMAARLGPLWLRAPLLVLLLAWLGLGIAGGLGSALWHRLWLETWPGFLAAIAFQVWGIGFLALVGFGFYARARKVRLRS
jgi:hypothetical protein